MEENLENKNKNIEEDEFSKYFNSLEKEHNENIEDSGDNTNTSETTSEDTSSTSEDASEDNNTQTDNNIEDNATSYQEDTSDDMSEEVIKKDIKKFIQRHKSLQGMWKSEKKKNEDMQLLLANINKKFQANESENAGSSNSDTAEDTAKNQQQEPKTEAEWVQSVLNKESKFTEMLEEFPELATAFSASMQKVFEEYSSKQNKQMEQLLQQTIAPIITSQKEKQLQEHISKIREAHPDFEKYLQSGELQKWVDTQTPRKKNFYLDIIKEGDSSEIIDMYNVFKQERSIPTKKVIANKPISDKRLEDMEDTASKTRTIDAGKAKASKDDFYAAFEEAVARDKENYRR